MDYGNIFMLVVCFITTVWTAVDYYLYTRRTRADEND